MTTESGQPSNAGQLCRGVPDVAALSGDAISNGYTIVSDGEDAGGGGTSLSSPLWAGMWADPGEHGARRHDRFGFANPAIYAIAKDPARYASAFHDITAGANGLNVAGPGYDYVTGFGVPRLAGLIQQVTGVAPAVAKASSACADRTAPVAAFAKKRWVRTSRKRVVLSGTASDRGCGVKGTGKVKRVRVAVMRKAGKRCRFLKGRKGFSAPRSCSKRIYLTAHGTSKWTLTYKGRVAKGAYRTYVRASDVSKNIQVKVTARRFRVR